MEDGWIRDRGAASASELKGEPSDTGIYLYWLPLGAGGSFVRFNGRVFEFIQARAERRISLALYHTTLVVVVLEGRFLIENSWPIPDAEGPSRGVTVEPIAPPAGGRAPGWRAGLVMASRYQDRRSGKVLEPLP